MGKKYDHANDQDDFLEELKGAIPESEKDAELYAIEEDEDEGFRGVSSAEDTLNIKEPVEDLLKSEDEGFRAGEQIEKEWGIKEEDTPAVEGTKESNESDSIILDEKVVEDTMKDIINEATTNPQTVKTTFEEEQVMNNVPVPVLGEAEAPKFETKAATTTTAINSGEMIEKDGKKYFVLNADVVDSTKHLTKNEIKEMINSTKLIEADVKASLVGKAKTEVYGKGFNVIVNPTEITRVVKEVLNKNLEILSDRYGVKLNVEAAKAFINSFQGVSVSFLNNKNGMVMTIDEAVRTTRETLLTVNQQMSAAEIVGTEKRAKTIVSKYIGKDITQLTHTNTTSIEVLVMRFNKNLIPKIQSGAGFKDDDRLIDFLLAPITNNFFKFSENLPNTDSIGWAIDLFKLFPYVQPDYTVTELKDTVKVDGVAICKDKISGMFLSAIYTYEKELNRKR